MSKELEAALTEALGVCLHHLDTILHTRKGIYDLTLRFETTGDDEVIYYPDEYSLNPVSEGAKEPQITIASWRTELVEDSSELWNIKSETYLRTVVDAATGEIVEEIRLDL